VMVTTAYHGSGAAAWSTRRMRLPAAEVRPTCQKALYALVGETEQIRRMLHGWRTPFSRMSHR
jgi:hypothetical protein